MVDTFIVTSKLQFGQKFIGIITDTTQPIIEIPLIFFIPITCLILLHFLHSSRLMITMGTHSLIFM